LYLWIKNSNIVESVIPLFVGKNIEHLFSDGVKYCGHVISVVPSFPKWYNVQYQNDEAIYLNEMEQEMSKICIFELKIQI
jgi:hypothetical protein